MKKLFLIICLSLIILINSGCPTPCVEANFSFAVNSQFSPDLDSIKVGDTIYLTSAFSTTLTDLSTNTLVNYNNSSGISSDVYINRYDSIDNSSNDAVFDFNYISIKGRIYNERNIASPDGVQQLTYQEDTGNYELKVGFIAQRKGDYIFNLGNGLSNGLSDNKKCEKAAFDISLTNTDQHFYLLQFWRPNSTVDGYGKEHVYYFKVY